MGLKVVFLAWVYFAGQMQSICCTNFMVNLYQGYPKWHLKCAKVTTRAAREQMRSICWTIFSLAYWVNWFQESRKWHLKCSKVTTGAAREQNEDNMKPDVFKGKLISVWSKLSFKLIKNKHICSKAKILTKKLYY